MTIKLQCPSCKSEDGLFASPRAVKSYNDLIGITCTNCGHKISDEDIKKDAIRIARELIHKHL